MKFFSFETSRKKKCNILEVFEWFTDKCSPMKNAHAGLCEGHACAACVQNKSLWIKWTGKTYKNEGAAEQNDDTPRNPHQAERRRSKNLPSQHRSFLWSLHLLMKAYSRNYTTGKTSTERHSSLSPCCQSKLSLQDIMYLMRKIMNFHFVLQITLSENSVIKLHI